VHLGRAIRGFEDGLGDLSESTRIDLALTLIEASQFPTMKWKQFAVHQAEIVARGLNDPSLEFCLAQSRSKMDRLAGNMEKATNRFDLPDQDRTSEAAQIIIHSAIGQVFIRRSLDIAQVRVSLADQKTLEKATFFTEQVHDLDTNYSTRQYFCQREQLQEQIRQSLAQVLSYHTCVR
jgi:hypothetical protein